MVKRALLMALLGVLGLTGHDAHGASERPKHLRAHAQVHPLPELYVTGYDDVGRTATGTWARSGECAVDPRSIPLGATITVPGLGTCHAEDTGGAVIGAHVDWWYPDAPDCYRVTGWYRGASWRMGT